jgi:Fic family protein
MADRTSKNKPLKKPLRKPVVDRAEHPSLMEPLTLSQDRPKADLDDLVLELVSESASFRSSMPEPFIEALSALVRSMNCYYSNLIEGHDTHPIEIEKARKKDYSDDPEKRNLQLEAEAHIAVQSWIDEGGMTGSAMSLQNLQEIHRRFYELLPEQLQWTIDPTTKQKIRIIPGALRVLDLKVGRHLAISPGAVPRFMQKYEQTYCNLNRSATILASAAAHHRLLWVHPFLDGNGRVARLMSYASLLHALDTGGIWSIARGLARQQEQKPLGELRSYRRGDFDDRGALSESSLEEFTGFFLLTCIDQVKFMKSLVRPDQLRKRVIAWANDEISKKTLPPRTTIVLESLLTSGELPRGDIPAMLNLSPASARRVISGLAEKGVLVSETSRTPVRLAFPATLASSWLGLFPDK